MNKEKKTEVDELKQFKLDCQTKSPDEVVQKHLIDGGCYFFDLYYDEYEEFKFKKMIADSLNVHIRDIAVVGSGKLGFSIKPNKDLPGLYEFKLFDQDYDLDREMNKSDLDVAIVSSQLFDEQLVNLYDHTDCYSTAYKNRNSFSKYILKGWLNPKFLPDSYVITAEIDEVKTALSLKYNRDVNIGIFKSWYFFEKYHRNNVHTLALNLIA